MNNSYSEYVTMISAVALLALLLKGLAKLLHDHRHRGEGTSGLAAAGQAPLGLPPKMSVSANGWVSYPLDHYMKIPDVVRHMEKLALSTQTWRDAFIASGMLKTIHHRNVVEVLSLALEIHQAGSADKERVTSAKRLVTVSCIVHNFAIPRSLYLLDLATISLLDRYLVYTQEIHIEDALKTHEIERRHREPEIYDADTRHANKRLIAALPTAIKLIAYAGQERPPNLDALLALIERSYPKLNEEIKHDRVKLGRLMTLAYGCLGLSVPGDYLQMNDFIHDYIRKEGRYTRFNPTDLKLIKTNKKDQAA